MHLKTNSKSRCDAVGAVEGLRRFRTLRECNGAAGPHRRRPGCARGPGAGAFTGAFGIEAGRYGRRDIVIATAGAETHGILARNFGTSAGDGAIVIDVGASVTAGGADAHGIAVGEVNDTDAVIDVSEIIALSR